MNDISKYTHVAAGIVMLPLMFGALVGAMFQRPASHVVYFKSAVVVVPTNSAACTTGSQRVDGQEMWWRDEMIRDSRCWEPT